MNKNKICVFDFETDGRDVDTINPVQLAAVIIDPRKLEIVKGGQFCSFMRPENIDDSDYFEKNRATIEWHSNVRDCTSDEIMELWENAPPTKSVWASFEEFLLRFHKAGRTKTKFSAPLACGYNILSFDMPIAERMCAKYSGGKQIFHPRDKIDLMHWMFPWFENSNEVTSYSMDNMREYFGISKDNAHDALKDVEDTAMLFCRFMRLYRRTSGSVKFKGAFGSA
jgi:DNA polymerase III epsilon subunit-like protein